MKKLVQFFSMAALTQLVLMLSQLVLLPIQISLWGHSVTAAWYSAIALAMVTSVFDCGLRTAGHSELLQVVNQPADAGVAQHYFQQIWAWIRVLVFSATAILIAADAIFDVAFKGLPYEPWKAALILATAIETLLVVRIMYLDTLGLYRGAEASYFTFAGLRLVLAVPALAVLHLGASGLAWLFLATSILALGLQGWMLCRGRASVLSVFAAFPPNFSVRVLAVTRYTLAEPCANWVRLSLPVLVISSIASPAAVTTYVALRAAFGAGRTTIQQLARFTSVEYLQFRNGGRFRNAESLLSAFVLLAVLIGTAVAGFVVSDNMRILGLWLKRFDRATFQTIAFTFLPGATFYAYQIVLSLMFRLGKLAWVARRHYAYIVYAGVFAVGASQIKTLPVYLGLLALSEVALSASFMLSGRESDAAFPAQAAGRGLVASAVGTVVVLLLWSAARRDIGHIFGAASVGAFAWTGLLFAFVIAAFALSIYLTNRATVSAAPFLFRNSRISANITTT